MRDRLSVMLINHCTSATAATTSATRVPIAIGIHLFFHDLTF